MSALGVTIVSAIVGLLGGGARRSLAGIVVDVSPNVDMVAIAAGSYTPVFAPSPSEQQIPVAHFFLDRAPVTNAQFLAFVTAHPEWRRDRVRRITADAGYLAHWAGPRELGVNARDRAPVTRVSWFAAKAYCEARGARLPMEAEWEYVASASETSTDGRKDPAWNARILAWYGKPGYAQLADVSSGRPNFFGVDDMHGLVWEWVLDFNSAAVGNDARANGDGNVMKFCGATALSAKDKSDYATFMRFAMRSSLAAAYTTNSLGFRCARDGGPEA